MATTNKDYNLGASEAANAPDRHSSDNDKFHQDQDAGHRRASIIGAKSPGVARVEAMASCLTTVDRIWLFTGVFLIAFTYSMDSFTRYTYQSYATSAFGYHSLLATINTVRTVIAAAAQPTAAKIADVFGRFELVCVSVFFYVLGTIIEAASNNVPTFATGAIFYQIGYTCVLLLVEVIVADLTSMRTRVFYSYIPAMPFIIITWVSGNVTQAVIGTDISMWRWGIGMWCIIYPVLALPLLSALWWTGFKAKRAGLLDSYKSPFQSLGSSRLAVELFHKLDVVGILFVIITFGLILTPLTIVGGANTQWGTAKFIAPFVLGVLLIPAFVFWELRGARHPLVPFYLLKDRGVWAALGIATFLNFAWYLQGDYLYTMLIVAFDFSITMATRILAFYTFFSVISGIVVSGLIWYTRRLKPFIIFGTCLFMVAFGLLINYRGGAGGGSKSGVIGAQVLLGLAGGMFPYPAQASIQAATKHEHVAIVTGLYLAVYSVGSAFGYAVSGTIWTQKLYPELSSRLAFQSNSTLATAIYGSPFSVVPLYPVGTEVRTAIIESYMHVQKLMCIVGLCLCIPLIVFALLLGNPKLSDEQSQPEAEAGYVEEQA